MNTPRNSLCSCGSNRKFKKCCWRPGPMSLAELREQESLELESRMKRVAEMDTKRKEALEHPETNAAFEYRRSRMPLAVFALAAGCVSMELKRRP